MAKQLRTRTANCHFPSISWIWLNCSLSGWRRRIRPKIATLLLTCIFNNYVDVETRFLSAFDGRRVVLNKKFLTTLLLVLTSSFSERHDEHFWPPNGSSDPVIFPLNKTEISFIFVPQTNFEALKATGKWGCQSVASFRLWSVNTDGGMSPLIPSSSFLMQNCVCHGSMGSCLKLLITSSRKVN